MALSRLEPQWRLLCVPAAVLALLPVIAGRLVLPALRSSSLAETLLRQCLVRTWTGLPCPLCGGTRAVVMAAHGAWGESLQQHPLGIMLVVGGAVTALWLLACAVSGRDAGLTKIYSLFARHLSWRPLVAGLLLLWLLRLLMDLVL